MKCMECGADLYEGIKKCPYCKTPTGSAEDGNFKDFDIKYTISSPEDFKAISGNTGSRSISHAPAKTKSLFGLKIRRIQKNPTFEPVKAPQTPDEKAREMAKSASQRAAEFVPEGMARYTIRGGDGREIKAPSYAQPQTFKPEVKTEVKPEVKKEEPKASASVSAPEEVKPQRKSRRKTKRNKKEFKLNFDKNIAIAAGAALLAVVVVVLAVTSLIRATSTSDEVMSSYTYVKDNELYMIYKGKTSKLSEQVVCDSYLRYAEETETAPSAEKAAKNAGIVKESKNGRFTYFFDDFDPETGSGTLKLVKSGKAKKIVEISPAVHNSIVMSKDGSKLLYLQTADENGDMGVLYYWDGKMEEPFKVATDIDNGTFGFADDEKWVIFIQNLNRIEMHGDLFAKSLENLKDEKVKIDSAVCKIYGTNPGKAAYIYAKDYDKTDKSFDIYAINKKGRSIRLGERTKRDPLMQKTKDSLFVYGISDDGLSNLYTVEIESGKKEKIASGINSILMMSKDEKTVIYDKVYTGKLADYYAYTKGKQPQLIAHNVVVDYNAVAGKPQMAVDKETSKILYISEFEAFKGGGTLNLTTYKKGKVVSEEQIAEDVYALYRAEDGKFVVAKDFSTSRKIFDLYLLVGNELQLLKEEVSPERFDVSLLGDNIYCVTGFGVEGSYGNLEKINIKGEAEVVADGIFDFEITAEDDLLLYKNLNTEDGSFDLQLRLDGKRKVLEIDNGVDEIVGY